LSLAYRFKIKRTEQLPGAFPSCPALLRMEG
jgi:hypothetical protein